MEAFKELFQINFSYVFLSVFSIFIGIKFMVSLFEWGIDKLGLETKWMRAKREEHNLIVQTTQRTWSSPIITTSGSAKSFPTSSMI